MSEDKTVTATFSQGHFLPKNLIVSSGSVLEDFESMSSWAVSGSGSGYSAVLDTNNYKDGAASIKLNTPFNGNVTITKSVNWDLSADQGNFRLWVYVSGASEPTGGSIILSSDTTFTNYYITSYGAAFKLRYKPGWNLINLRTSDWKVGKGSPSWGNIVSIRIRLDSRTVNSYSFDGLTSGVVAQPAVLFTFDKGSASLYSQAFSYMNSLNVRGTGYIPTNLVGSTGQATWGQLQEMFAAGWTIGNQTMSNVDLTTLDQAGQVAELNGALSALNMNGITTGNYVAYPSGKYNADTLTAMANLGMRTGRTQLAFNNLLPLPSPFEIAQRQIIKSTTLSTAQGWLNTAKSRQEILVISIQGLTASPGTNDWYIARFQSLVNYCIQQGVPIITMDDLYQLQSVGITIP
jgi:peptidoglycan/xylan/chitin deacetylase (PgdA/CDA1 family)